MARIPLQTTGDPEDIAASALFLASADGSYISGVNLFVDGGWEQTATPTCGRSSPTSSPAPRGRLMDMHIDPNGRPDAARRRRRSRRCASPAPPPSPDARATLARLGHRHPRRRRPRLRRAGHVLPAGGRVAAEPASGRRACEGMLAYAAGKGWTDGAGRIRAHAEWDG